MAAGPRSGRGDDEGGGGATVYLVSCVKEKRATRALAKDLYISAWFRKARAYVEGTDRPWRILSARYGLLDPGRPVRPYDRMLEGLPRAERRAWADRVLAAFHAEFPDVSTVELLAGERYREFLQPALEARSVVVQVPMAGLRIGEQMAWLDRRVRRRDADELASGDLLG
ncbi:MAG: hypothetical protein OXH08_00225 [Gammaproteobacteria bacterium]|nr:hypothetical protein [Gammaproteobacteria bacterium]